MGSLATACPKRVKSGQRYPQPREQRPQLFLPQFIRGVRTAPAIYEQEAEIVLTVVARRPVFLETRFERRRHRQIRDARLALRSPNLPRVRGTANLYQLALKV